MTPAITAAAAAVLGRLGSGPVAASRTELAAAVAGDAHGLDDDATTTTALVLRGLAVQSGEPVPATPASRRALWERGFDRRTGEWLPAGGERGEVVLGAHLPGHHPASAISRLAMPMPGQPKSPW